MALILAKFGNRDACRKTKSSRLIFRSATGLRHLRTTNVSGSMSVVLAVAAAAAAVDGFVIAAVVEAVTVVVGSVTGSKEDEDDSILCRRSFSASTASKTSLNFPAPRRRTSK